MVSKRRPKGVPWYWAERDGWYINLPDGRERILDRNGEPLRGSHQESLAIELWEEIKVLRRLHDGGKGKVTLKILFELFMQDCERRKLSSCAIKSYHIGLKDFLERWPDLNVDELTPRNVNLWFDEHPQWGESTRAIRGKPLQIALNWGASAASGWLIDRNPLRGMEFPRVRSRGADCEITPEVHARLLSLACPTTQDVLTVLWETGTRPINIRRVTAQHINLERKVWVFADTPASRQDSGVIHKTYRKTRKPLIVPLTDVVVDICRRLIEIRQNGPIFLNQWGNPWSRERLARAIRWLLKKAGLNLPITPYSYRHHKATYLLEQGVPDATVAAILGQTNTAMLHAHYSHLGSRVKHLTDVLDQHREEVDGKGQAGK